MKQARYARRGPGPAGRDRSSRLQLAAPIALGIDAVGGEATERLAQSLAPGATLVNYGAMGGEPCMLSPASLIFRGIVLRGFWLARWFTTSDPEARARLFGELASMVAAGRLNARIHATYGIDQIKAAVKAADAGARSGKILVLPNQGDAGAAARDAR